MTAGVSAAETDVELEEDASAVGEDAVETAEGVGFVKEDDALL